MKHATRNQRRKNSFARTLRVEQLEGRALLAQGTFEPPAAEITPANPVQTVRVLVLNYDPTVPSQGNQKLRDLFHWNDPRELAEGFIADMESASGGAVAYEIVQWRDLNEFPIFEDGTRYDADQYVQNRQTNTGWSASSADFYAIAEQQGLAELVNNDVIDEIWMFGDHYFALLGEAWMAGPQSFFVNGPSFPDFPVDRAVAGYGFNYERGVAEMVHNLGHRTENHISRAYGGWNIANPVTPWDYFTANVAQTNRTAYGVGSVHFPFNANGDYDYGNMRTFDSYADDFVANFPQQTYLATPTDRDVWGDNGVGDWHRGYLHWFFGHMPRDSGTAPDGRAINWFKYIFDFNAYRPNTGLPRDNEAILGAPDLTAAAANHEFTLRFYDNQGIDPATLDDFDVRVTGPNGFNQLAALVAVGPAEATTAGTARTVRYRIAGPGGGWDAADSGAYSISLVAGQVRDLGGTLLPVAALGQLQVNIVDGSVIDVAALLAAGEATVDATPWDIGGPAAIFDASTSSLYRTPSINPAVVTLSFDEAQSIAGFRAMFAGSGGNPGHHWQVEIADTLADLDAQAGTYQLIVPTTGAVTDVFSTVTLENTVAARHVRLTTERLTGDDYVHIRTWQLLSADEPDQAAPTAELAAPVEDQTGGTSTSFAVRYADDSGVDIRSVNYGDVRVTGPGGFSQTAALYGLDANANGPVREVTYFVSPPGGTWDVAENGVYTIELLAGQVEDAAGNAAAAQSLGTFTVAVPAPQARPRADLTELNAGEWAAWADGATASTAADLDRKTLGASSIRFDTTGGFDTLLRYEPAEGAMWDLSAATMFRFDVFAENPSPIGFQVEPVIRFIDLDGDVAEFTYWRSGSPYPLWNDARGAWRSQSIDIKSTAQPATGWRSEQLGSPDWSRMRTVEIHADTWDHGFSLWFDRLGFNLPVSVLSTELASGAPPRHALTLTFDESIGDTLAASDLLVRNLATEAVIPAGAMAVAASEGGTVQRVTFPGVVGGVLPSGAYRLTISQGRVADVAGNTLASDLVHDFVVLNGDYDGNQQVDGADFLRWQRSYGALADYASDGNGDGAVGAADLAVWQADFGQAPEAAPALATRQALAGHTLLAGPMAPEMSMAAALDAAPGGRASSAPSERTRVQTDGGSIAARRPAFRPAAVSVAATTAALGGTNDDRAVNQSAGWQEPSLADSLLARDEFFSRWPAAPWKRR